ncbi:hypothetical protein HDU96_000360 [Phlyctochytrium bullatum]|nr:hypothetical protein HDU96_000360 [Phlyctochytrium bullatum]
MRKYTWKDIEAINAEEPRTQQLLVIKGKVYDIGGDFVKWHPGGRVALSQVGRDATGAFEAFHTENAESILSNHYAGDLDPSESILSEFERDVEQLHQTLEELGVFKSSKFYYGFKLLTNVSILVLSVFILCTWPGNSLAVITSACVLALFWQQCGWLAHDFLHHQVFTNRAINDGFGYLVGNVAQGFSVAWWKDKHCTHHSLPNVHQQDPDIDTMPYLAWSEHALELFVDMKDSDVARFLVANQPVLYFPILAFARMAWAFASILFVSKEELPAQKFVVEAGTLFLHWTWYLGLAFSNGMPVFSQKTSSRVGFHELQVVTGRDVASTPLVDWFTGGLNFQIEHHLFPALPRHQFHRVQPLVESLCKKHGIPYHRTSFWVGLSEVIARLSSISKASLSYKLKK